jgi:hypothetical protein
MYVWEQLRIREQIFRMCVPKAKFLRVRAEYGRLILAFVSGPGRSHSLAVDSTAAAHMRLFF